MLSVGKHEKIALIKPDNYKIPLVCVKQEC